MGTGRVRNRARVSRSRAWRSALLRRALPAARSARRWTRLVPVLCAGVAIAALFPVLDAGARRLLRPLQRAHPSVTALMNDRFAETGLVVPIRSGDGVEIKTNRPLPSRGRHDEEVVAGIIAYWRDHDLTANALVLEERREWSRSMDTYHVRMDSYHGSRRGSLRGSLRIVRSGVPLRSHVGVEADGSAHTPSWLSGCSAPGWLTFHSPLGPAPTPWSPVAPDPVPRSVRPIPLAINAACWSAAVMALLVVPTSLWRSRRLIWWCVRGHDVRAICLHCRDRGRIIDDAGGRRCAECGRAAAD